MTLFLLLSAFLPQDDLVLREQIDLAIREEYGNQELRKLAKMPGAAASVMKRIHDGDKRLTALVNLLGHLKAKESEALLLAMLKNESSSVRVGAAGALARLGCRAATNDIASLLQAPDLPEADKAAVAWSLGELGDPKGLEALKAYRDDLRRRDVKLIGPNVRTEHAIAKLEALATNDPLQREKRLSDLLVRKHDNGDERDLRLWAADRLADDQCAKSIPLIRSILPDLEGQAECQARALEAVRRLGGELSEQEAETLRKHESP